MKLYENSNFYGAIDIRILKVVMLHRTHRKIWSEAENSFQSSELLALYC